MSVKSTQSDRGYTKGGNDSSTTVFGLLIMPSLWRTAVGVVLDTCTLARAPLTAAATSADAARHHAGTRTRRICSPSTHADGSSSKSY